MLGVMLRMVSVGGEKEILVVVDRQGIRVFSVKGVCVEVESQERT